jgi:hypothetical protein
MRKNQSRNVVIACAVPFCQTPDGGFCGAPLKVDERRPRCTPRAGDIPPGGAALTSARGGGRLPAARNSRDALDAAQSRFESMGDEVPEDVRGRRLSVDAYEVLFDGAP